MALGNDSDDVDDDDDDIRIFFLIGGEAERGLCINRKAHSTYLLVL